MSSESFARNAHSVGINAYHLEWCTKFRFKTLAKESHLNDCERSVRAAAERHGIRLLELSVMPEHVHAVAELSQCMSPARAVGLLKGASAYDLFRSHPNFRKLYPRGSFWSRGYFYRSVSDASLDVVRHYVRYDNDPRQQTLAAY